MKGKPIIIKYGRMWIAATFEDGIYYTSQGYSPRLDYVCTFRKIPRYRTKKALLAEWGLQWAGSEIVEYK